MRISDWSSDVCSSDLCKHPVDAPRHAIGIVLPQRRRQQAIRQILVTDGPQEPHDRQRPDRCGATVARGGKRTAVNHRVTDFDAGGPSVGENASGLRSEEHTSEPQSLMRISYAVFCLKKKKHTPNN